MFVALTIISTCCEIRSNIVQRGKNSILCVFSVYSNSKRILTMKPMLPNEMAFLHGIRSIAIIWIVLGHTYSISFWSAPIINANSLIDEFTKLFAPVLFAGVMAVDTFFMLSAMLLTLSVFKELNKT